MDTLSIDTLANCLNVNVPSDEVRKVNEAALAKFKLLPKYGPLLLEIGCNVSKKYADEVSLNAVIQLKNFIFANWKFTNDQMKNKSLVFDEDDIIIIINDQDKEYIKQNIIDAIIFAVDTENVRVLKQLNQCAKKILYFDFENGWKENFFLKIETCFKSGNQKKIYAGILLLHQVSKVYEFESKEKMQIYSNELVKVNDYLLNVLGQCEDLNNPIQAQFSYKILKIFFKCFQGSIPEFLCEDETYGKWSNSIIKVMQFQIAQNNMENQNNIFWKLKKIAFQTITRIYQKHTLVAHDKFSELLTDKYGPMYFAVIKTIYTTPNNSNYINDNCLHFIYSFLTYVIQKKKMAENVIEIFLNDTQREQLIKDAMMTKDEILLWVNEPKTYISNYIDDIGKCITKKYSVAKLVDHMINYRESGQKKQKKNPPKYFNSFLTYFTSILEMNTPKQIEENQLIQNSQNAANFTIESISHNLIKEAVMYLISSSNDFYLKYAPLVIEEIIAKYIIPELESPVGIMREKASIFIRAFKNLNYKNEKIPCEITVKLCGLLEKDKCLPVRIQSAIAAASLMNQPGTKMLLKGNIKILLSIYLTLIEETDLEEIVESLQNVIREFKEETTEFIVQLCDYLIKYFNKLTSKEIDEDKTIDNQALISNVISTFIEIIHFFVNNPQIFPSLFTHIETILNHTFSETMILEMIDDGLDILMEILKYSEKIPNRLWIYYVKCVTCVIGTPAEVEELKKEFPNQLYEGCGLESLSEIAKIICYFIAKDPDTFITGNDGQGTSFLSYAVRLVQHVVELCERKSSYVDVKYVFEILVVILNVFRGKIDNVHNEILQFLLKKIDRKDEKFKTNLRTLLSACVIYNPTLCIQYYDSINESKTILKFWFDGLDNLTQRKQLKYNLMGLCCLISVDPAQQNKQVIQNMKNLIDKIIQLLEKIYEMNNKNKKNGNDGEEDDDEFEEIDDDEENDNKKEDLYKKLLLGELEDFEDEEISDYDGDEEGEEQALIDIDKQSEILFLRDTLSHISQKNPEYYHNITTILGDKVGKLKEIFDKEEQKNKK